MVSKSSTEEVRSHKTDEGVTLDERLARVYAQQDARFHLLVQSAGLNPDKDFNHRDLRNLYFAKADLRGFNFAGSNLVGTNLRLAEFVDRTTLLDGAILDVDDAAWQNDRVRPISEEFQLLASDLRRAFDQGEFELIYQPKFDLREKIVTGAEALLRWNHPQRGIIPPAQFVPVLEEANLINKAQYWVIETAIRDYNVLLENGRDMEISLNMSRSIFEERDFVTNCERLMHGNTVRLKFELSETDFIFDVDASISIVKKLADLGIHIAIDDYGAGLSSLAYLKQIPARELKIDRSLISKLTSDSNDALVVRSSIDLAHALEMTVTAEGVETHAQLALLVVMGCDAAQGFLLGKPRPIEDFFLMASDPVTAFF